MPRRLSSHATPADRSAEPNVVEFPTPVKVKNPAAVALGKLGGSKGGLKRAENLSAEQKKAIAQQGAQARWARFRVKKAAEASASRREGGSDR